jgi:hypothetical protein
MGSAGKGGAGESGTAAGSHSEERAWLDVLAIADELDRKSSGHRCRISDVPSQLRAIAVPMLAQLKKGLHRNPPLVVYLNPPKGAKLLGRRVYGLEYQHATDGKDYRHDFGPKVRMYELPSGAVLLAHVDGNALVGEYPG